MNEQKGIYQKPLLDVSTDDARLKIAHVKSTLELVDSIGGLSDRVDVLKKALEDMGAEFDPPIPALHPSPAPGGGGSVQPEGLKESNVFWDAWRKRFGIKGKGQRDFTPGGILGLKDENTYLDVDTSDNLTFTDANAGTLTLTQLGSARGYSEDVSSAATWNIGHSLNTTKIIVQIWKDNDTFITPDSITIDDANNITITFNEAIAGYVNVIAL